MSLSAFHGDATIRNAAIGRLGTCLANGARSPGLFRWDGTSGSISGCLIGSADPATWREKLGLAPWLAYAFDALTSGMQNDQSQNLVRNLLYAVPLGADTASLAYHLTNAMLRDVIETTPLPLEIRNPLEAVEHLHRRSVANEYPAPMQWRQARRAMTAATVAIEDASDTKSAEPAIKKQIAAGMVGEAAAWNPDRSSIMPAEVIRHWLSLKALNKDAAFGWTYDDDVRARRLMTSIWERFMKDTPEEERDIFQILELENPSDAARFRAYERYGEEHVIVQAEVAAQLFQGVLESRT